VDFEPFVRTDRFHGITRLKRDEFSLNRFGIPESVEV
jgi:hypothetical protein